MDLESNVGSAYFSCWMGLGKLLNVPVKSFFEGNTIKCLANALPREGIEEILSPLLQISEQSQFSLCINQQKIKYSKVRFGFNLPHQFFSTY